MEQRYKLTTATIPSLLEADQRFKERCAWVDGEVRASYEQHLAERFAGRMAIFAVGGFGRGDLFPYSDIDLLLLVNQVPELPAEREAIAFFQRRLWDASLRLSQGLRTVLECVTLDEQDVERTVSLLDRRLLCGSEALQRELEQKMPRFLQSKRGTLERHLCRISKERHAKFAHTIFHLEPEIKDAPGGLRDLNLLHWLEEPAVDLVEAREFLFGVRFLLHDRSKRDNNLLNFDLQEEIFADPEASLRDYYRHARAVHRAALRAIERHEGQASGLLSQFRDWRTRLSNEHFTVSRERTFFRSVQATAEVKLKLFSFIARHGVGLAPDTEERLQRSRAELREVRLDWSWWKDLLNQEHSAQALRAMHETGALSAQLPEWEHVESLVTRDFYHRYTVDEHTLVALETLDEIKRGADSATRRFGELMRESEGLAPLRFALLLHDVGKGTGKDHSEESVRVARVILERLGAPEAEREAILFLIEQHLILSALMSSRDLTDPAVVHDGAHRIGTLERLKLLTLLTYADIAAVNPETMTPWRGEQLWRAYRVIRQELTRELRTERIADAGDDPWLQGFPTRYLRTHGVADFARHRKLAEEARVTGASLDLRKTDAAWEASFVAADRPGLFAAVCGSLASLGMSILKVEAFANTAGQVLDTFTFGDPLRTLELNPSEIDTVRRRVLAAIKGSGDVEKWLKARPKPKIRVASEPVVVVDNESTDSATLVEIVADDRPGLLYDIASTLSTLGCSIDVVLIDTEAHRALDTLYITKNGERLDAETAAAVRSRLLVVCGQ